MRMRWNPIVKKDLQVTARSMRLSWGVFAYETHKVSMRVPEPLIDALLAYSVELGNYLISLYDQA